MNILRELIAGRLRFQPNEKYIEWVRTRPCVLEGWASDHVCGGRVDPHHLVGDGLNGKDCKVPDELTMPLCRDAHNLLHHDRREWEDRYGSQYKWVMLTLFQALMEGVLVLAAWRR